MNKEDVKNYILKYKNQYSKEDINSQLKNFGVTEEQLNYIYSEINNESKLENHQDFKKTNKGLIGFF